MVKPEAILEYTEKAWPRIKALAHTYYQLNKRLLGLKRMREDLEVKAKIDDSVLAEVVDPTIEKVMEQKKELTQRIKDEMRNHPLYQYYLKHLKGISEVTACLLIGFVPAWKPWFSTVSKLWMYTGIVPPEILAQRDNRFSRKAKMAIFTATTSLIRFSNFYRRLFEKYYSEELAKMSKDYKGPGTPPKSKEHAYARARRKVAKVFACHYWAAVRLLCGLPAPAPYPVFKIYMGQGAIPPIIDHGKTWKEFVTPWGAKVDW